MTDRAPSEQAALKTLQSAIASVLHWSRGQAPTVGEPTEPVKRAQSLMGWTETSQIGPLRLLFDGINLSDQSQDKPQKNWCGLDAIANQNPRVPDPSKERPSDQ
ncbi:MAG: hypothetical protein WA902_13550 [Thermosynechococcaceae cyanobacterium]